MLQWSVSPLRFQWWQIRLKATNNLRPWSHLKPPHIWMIWMWIKMRDPLTFWQLLSFRQKLPVSERPLFFQKKHPRPKIDSPNWENESISCEKKTAPTAQQLSLGGWSRPSRLARWSPSLISDPMASLRLCDWNSGKRWGFRWFLFGGRRLVPHNSLRNESEESQQEKHAP